MFPQKILIFETQIKPESLLVSLDESKLENTFIHLPPFVSSKSGLSLHKNVSFE